MGPSPRPPEYTKVGTDAPADMDIDANYRWLTRLTELELIGICQTDPDRITEHLGRAQVDKGRWVESLAQGNSAVPRGPLVGRNLLWIGDRTKEVLGLRTKTAEGAARRKASLEARIRQTGRDFGDDPEILAIVGNLRNIASLPDPELEKWSEAATNAGAKLAADHGRQRAKRLQGMGQHSHERILSARP